MKKIKWQWNLMKTKIHKTKKITKPVIVTYAAPEWPSPFSSLKHATHVFLICLNSVRDTNWWQGLTDKNTTSVIIFGLPLSYRQHIQKF